MGWFALLLEVVGVGLVLAGSALISVPALMVAVGIIAASVGFLVEPD